MLMFHRSPTNHKDHQIALASDLIGRYDATPTPYTQ
jgi:hypothetical protein